jgi:hypothetical protein
MDALRAGLWKDARQRPYDFHPELTARPWHEPAGAHPLAAAAAALEVDAGGSAVIMPHPALLYEGSLYG